MSGSPKNMNGLVAIAVLVSGCWLNVARAAEPSSSALIFDYSLVHMRAQSQNDASSQFLLGEMYRRGRLVNRDSAQATQWYQRAAEQGYVPAQLQLGVAYLQGDGIERNVEQARHWLLPAAQSGNAEAQCQLGHAFRQGDDSAASLLEAARWYSKAAEQNHPGAQYELGLMFADGMGVDRSAESALFWLERAAANDHRTARKRADAIASESGARAALAPNPIPMVADPVVQKAVLRASTAKPRSPKPMKTVATVANKKSPARFVAARPQPVTRLRPPSPQRPANLLRVSAAQAAPAGPADTDLDGQFALGVRLLKGEGVSQDIPKGLFWLRKAAGKEHPMALFVLGQLYMAGYGVEKNPELAVRLLREAASRGVVAAKNALAQMEGAAPQQAPQQKGSAATADPEASYKSGLESLNDRNSDQIKQAIAHFEGAAAQGHVLAQAKLGEIFFQGKRTRRDYDAAFIWYQAAAQAGNSEAQYWLGEMYRQGLGTTADNALASKWFRQAARLGHPMARDRLGGCVVCD